MIISRGILCADADVICCETVINPLEMFPHMIAAATDGADDDDDIKFLFTIRYTHAHEAVFRVTVSCRSQRHIGH